MSISVGDNVKIIYSGTLYTHYEEWIKENAPEYLYYFAIGDYPDLTNNIFKVVATGVNKYGCHLVLIQDAKARVFLIEANSVEKLPDIKLFNTVYVINKEYCYEDFQDWLRLYNPYMLQFYKPKTYPEYNKEYSVLFTAPKADFAPFSEEKLFLITDNMNPSNSNQEKREVFIMDQRGLIPKSVDICKIRYNL